MVALCFQQVDVFAGTPFRGNPLAVVIGADGLSDAQMAQIANWTNLSETSFLLQPRHPAADYRVRIFTPHMELPFAGHPTLGSAHVWRSLGLAAKSGDGIVQECGVGLVQVRTQAGRLAFAAPPRRRSGVPTQAELAPALAALKLSAADILEAQWVDNGPGWLALRLPNREAVLAVQPDWALLMGQRLGVVGACDGPEAQFELRAFVGAGQGWEDPVTGSLNAGIGQWLIETKAAPARYVASQGTALGRAGRVFVEQVGADIWVGGEVTTRISGTINVDAVNENLIAST